MMLVANFFFALVDTSTKWLLGVGFVAIQLAFLRYAVQFIFSAGDALIMRRLPDLRPIRENFWLLMIRGGCLVLSTAVNFFALNFLSLTVTSAIMFSAPLIVCGLSWPMLGERVGPVRLGFIILGFVGVLFVIRPFDADLQWGAVMMLIPATGMALYSILTRILAKKVEPAAMQLTLGVLGTLVLGPFAFAYWTPPTSFLEAVLMIGLGFFAWIGHEILVRAHKVADASILMPFTYSFLIYMALGGYVVFGDIPERSTILGAALIALSGVLIWARERQIKT